eukprot:g1139.t1
MGAGASSTEDNLKTIDPALKIQNVNQSNLKAKFNQNNIETSDDNDDESVDSIGSEDTSNSEDVQKGKKNETEEDIAYKNIKDWNDEQKAKRLALYIIFGQFDEDSSGRISLEEFEKLIQVVLHEHELESSIDHKNDEQAKIILSFIDQDKSNSIDELEFVEWIEDGK